MNPNETSDQQGGQQAMFPTEGQEGGSEGREEGLSSDAQASFEPSRDESRVESVEKTRRPARDEVVESREPVMPEIVVEVPAIEPEEKAKPVKGGRKRKSTTAPAAVAAKPKGRAKKATAEKAAPVPKAPRRSARAEKVEKVETLIPESTVVTGSSDRHQLILEESDEEPLVPSPGRRPRTYRDLDEIPDDLD